MDIHTSTKQAARQQGQFLCLIVRASLMTQTILLPLPIDLLYLRSYTVFLIPKKFVGNVKKQELDIRVYLRI